MGLSAEASAKADVSHAKNAKPRVMSPGLIMCRQNCIGFNLALDLSMAKGLSSAKQRLYESSGDQFHILVVSILTPLMSPLIITKRLGLLDRKGVDAFAVHEKTQNFEIVIQCKGFESPKFDKSHLKQCIVEIDKYLEKGPEVICYQLVLNRYVEGDDRKVLLQNLNRIVDSGKAKKVELLDLNKLLNRIEDLAIRRISNWAISSGISLIHQYGSRLNEVDYIPDVPFVATTRQVNPVRYIVEKIQIGVARFKKDQTSRNRPTVGLLLTSSFGFGKTRALHTITQELIWKKFNVLLVPAAMLEATFFSNVSGLTHSILNILLPEDEEFDELVFRILRDALKTKIIGSKNWVLLIDGLDEHPSAYKSQSLYTLWYSIKDLGIPFVITARDELVDARPLEFTSTINTERFPNFERVKLLEWSNELILDFISNFGRKKEQPPPVVFSVFEETIRKNGYREVYGDIPERPLFLSMLAQDAWAGVEPSKKLHVLYENYFRRKFNRDIQSGYQRTEILRPSEIVNSLGADEACHRLIEMMTKLSRQLIDTTGKAESYYQGELFSESDVRRLLTETGLPSVMHEEVLMHSLLLPAGRHPKSGERLARFAHKSFQDWFTARSLVANLEMDFVKLPPSVAKFLQAMLRDQANAD